MNEQPLLMGELVGASVRQRQHDDRILQRAIKQRWPVPEKYRSAMIDRQIQIATEAEYNAREATSAFVAILAADRLNVMEEQGPAKDESSHVHFHSGAAANDGAGVVTGERLRRAMAAISAGRDSGGPDSDDRGGE